VLIFFPVRSVYATRLGASSRVHYGASDRNFWELAKPLLDLPLKPSPPRLLWAEYYLRG